MNMLLRRNYSNHSSSLSLDRADKPRDVRKEQAVALKQCKSLFIFCAIALLQACTQIDDYMLGKDNTLSPTPLTPIKQKVILAENWSVFTGSPGKTNDELKMSPVTDGGVIYTASVDGVVQATDKNKGSIIWSKKLPQYLMSGPAVGNGYIAVASAASSVIVLNQSNGDVVWQANLSGDSLSKPVISGRQLFIKTIDGNLYAFDLKKGDKLWVVDHGSPHLILKASSAPVLFNQLVLAGFSDGKLDAVEKSTGRLVWQRNIAFASGGSDVERMVDIDADPIVRGEQIYLASYQGYVGALSLQNGEFIWQQPASVYKNIAISGDTVYYVDSDSTLWARNRRNGHVKWKQEAFKARGLTEPVLMGNRVFVGDKSGFLHGLDVDTGELISRTAVKAPILLAPVVSSSNIYVLASNGKLSCFSVK